LVQGQFSPSDGSMTHDEDVRAGPVRKNLRRRRLKAPETEPQSQKLPTERANPMHADFTNPRAGKAARLTGGARALGTALAKRLDAWLGAWAHAAPSGFLPVGLRPGGMGWTVLPPAPAPSPGARPLLHPAAVPLVRACPEGPPARPRTFGRRAALRPATLRPSRLRSRRAPLEARDLHRVSKTGSLRRKRRHHDAVGQSWLRL
jgi:hypothetical protein